MGTGRGPSLHKGEHGPARCSHVSSFHCLPSSPARRPGEHRPGRDIQPLATAAAPAASSTEGLVLGVQPHQARTPAAQPLPSLPNYRKGLPVGKNGSGSRAGAASHWLLSLCPPSRLAAGRAHGPCTLPHAARRWTGGGGGGAANGSGLRGGAPGAGSLG